MKGFFKKSTALVLALMMVLSMFAGAMFNVVAAVDATTGIVYFENIEDNLNADYSAIGGISLQNNPANVDGMLDISGDTAGTQKSITLGSNGSLKNYVFEADVYMGLDEAIRGPGNDNGTNGVNFSLRSTQTRLLGSIKHDTNDADGDGDKTDLLYNYLSSCYWQDLSGSSSYMYTYADGSDHSSLGTADISTKTKVRIVALDGKVIFTATRGSVSKTVTLTGGKNGAALPSASTLKIGLVSYVCGTVAKIDNMRIALLDNASGTVRFDVPNTVVATGTKDADLGITCVEEIDVFGEAVYLDGGAVEFVDNYDVTKPGVRKAILKCGTTTQQVDITYADTTIYVDEDFNDGATGANLSNVGGVIEDGKLKLGSSLRVTPTVTDFVLDYDYTPTLTNSAATSDVLLHTYIRGNNYAANGSYEVTAWYEVDDFANKSGWRLLMLRSGNTSEGKKVASNWNTGMTASKTLDPTGATTYHVNVTAVGSSVTATVYKYNADGSMTQIVTYTTVGKDNVPAEAPLSGKIWIAGNSNATVYVDNIKLRAYTDTVDQDAYSMTVSDDAAAALDLETGTITATGTASVNYYGFKASETVSLANATVAYNGDNTATVTYAGFSAEIPCTIVEHTNQVETLLSEPTEVVTGKPLNFDSNYKELALEYDITPYQLDFFKNPVTSVRFYGDGTTHSGKTVATYEVGVFYSTYNSSKSTAGVEFPVGSNGADVKNNYMRLYYRYPSGQGGADRTPASRFDGFTTNAVVTEENYAAQTHGTEGEEGYNTGLKSSAPATKLTEGLTTYRVRVVIQNGTITYKVAVKGEDAIDWDAIEATAVGDVGITGKFYFEAAANSAAIINNVTIENLAPFATLSGEYVAHGQAVAVGTPATELSFAALTTNGKEIPLHGSAADAIAGYDANKVGAQDVTITIDGQTFTKRVIVTDEVISVFEDFSVYNIGDMLYTNNTAGNTITWNTNSPNNSMIAQADGTIMGAAGNALLNNTITKSNDGILSADITVPSVEENTANHKMFSLIKFGGWSFDFGIYTTPSTITTNKAYALINYVPAQTENADTTRVLAKAEIDFSFDQLYRMELRIYGNTIKGVIDGKTVVSYVMAADDAAYAHLTTVASAQGNEDRWGFFGHSGQGVAKEFAVEGITSVGNTIFKADNILKSNSVTTYAVDGSAINATNTLPTVAQAGDKVFVSADINRNGALKANDYNVFINKDTMYGDWSKNTPGGAGDTFMFVMPAEDVVLTISNNDALAEGEYSIATGATATKKFYNEETNEFEKYGVRFLNRLYLPGISADGVDLGNVSAFGALLLPVEMLDGATTLTIDDVAAKNAFDAKAYDGKNSQIYNITAKYIDYVAVVKTSNADREFICVPYAVVDGEYVYGESKIASYN